MLETIFIILFLFSLYIYKSYTSNDVIKITLENKKDYIVRNLQDSKIAAETLDKIKNNLILLVDNIIKNNNIKLSDIPNPNYNDYLIKIKHKLKTVRISESSVDTSYTSYSVNKGEELVFCIRSKIDGKIHNMNELMYVAIHEIAHIGCPEVGHTELFKEINYYLLNKAKEYKIYNYINYINNPIEYCGLTLNNNLLNK
jgi:hypothetical protein